ncbi:MAG: nuclease-related domain-containing protein [Syntrophobacteraceae bacterium]
MREMFVTDNVANEINGCRKIITVAAAVLAAAIIAVCVGIGSPATPLIYIGMPFAFGSVFLIASKTKERTIYRKGREGEIALRTYLHSVLDDEYKAYFGMPVESGDIDCIVVGPSGLFCLEAKNHNGEIFYDDGGWRQVKVGRGGTVYQGHLKNPSGQVKKALCPVKSYLSAKDIRAWIQGVVVFTNPDVALSIEKDLKPVVAVKLSELDKLFENRNIMSKGKSMLIERALNEISASKVVGSAAGNRLAQKELCA